MSSMQPQKKDAWDRVSAFAAILIPAAIALAGHLISQGLKEAELASEAHRAEQTRVMAEANTKIAQANLVNTLMKSLTSSNPQERKLAVQAVLIALPDTGLLFARTIAEMDEDQGVQASARQSIVQRVDTLARELFAEDKPTRIAAANELIQTWRNEPSAVAAIVETAKAQPKNEDGVFNSAVVLAEMTPKALAQQGGHVDQFVNLASSAGPKTRAHVEQLRIRSAEER